MTHLTLEQFHAIRSEKLERLATRWVQVTNDDKPLFEIKRGSVFIFGNESLPRIAWQKFKNMQPDARHLFLESGVCVLTSKSEDTFLVRLAESSDDAPV